MIQGFKGVSEQAWYLPNLNSGAPVGCAHSIFGVTDKVSPYEEITSGFLFQNNLCSEDQTKTYGDTSSVTSKMECAGPIYLGAPLSKVDG